MKGYNRKQFWAIQRENEKRILSICPNIPTRSGIYFFYREENGLRFGYVGKAKNLRERTASHLSGRIQHIDRSIKAHGLYSEGNPTGYKLRFFECLEANLDEMERINIAYFANKGYQLRNVESGGTAGKTDINERKPAKGYYDGLEQGRKNTRRFIADLFNKHLDYCPKPKKGKFPTENQKKAMEKFKNFIESEEENGS